MRGKCSYGDKCFRKNPEHKAEFSHPGDADWDAPAAGYQAAGAPAAPFPDDGQTEEDRGLLGGLGGAAAAAGGLGIANHFGAFAGKIDPNDPEGKKHGFVQDHKVMAGLLAVGGVIAAGVAGSALEDGLKGKKDGKSGKSGKESGGMLGGLFGGKKNTGKKKDKGKKESSGKKDKKTKSRDLGDGVLERGFDPNAEDSEDSASSYETGPEDEGYDPVKHSDGRPRTP